MIAKSMNQDFEHRAPVHQILLGTTSTGTSHCKGQVTCVVEENPNGVSILCSIAGTVESKTSGTNGPAIIKSTAVTSYVAKNRLTFDGMLFACNPSSVTSCTRVTITGVGSSLPGLRGRVVIRVAESRAQDSRAQAEAIVKTQTEAELRQRIDAVFETRIADLNSQFASKLSILKYFPGSKNQLQLCSRNDGVELALGHSSTTALESETSRDSIGETVEVWLRRSDNLIASGPMTKILFSKAPVWLSTYFAETPIFLKQDERKWGIEVRDKWIVVKLHE